MVAFNSLGRRAGKTNLQHLSSPQTPCPQILHQIPQLTLTLSRFALSPISLTLLLWPDQWTMAWLCAESPVSANVVLVSFSSSSRKRVALSGSRSRVPGACCPLSLSAPRGLLLAPSPRSAFSGSSPLRLFRPERGATAADAPEPGARCRDSARSPGATANRGLPSRGRGAAGALPRGPS